MRIVQHSKKATDLVGTLILPYDTRYQWDTIRIQVVVGFSRFLEVSFLYGILKFFCRSEVGVDSRLSLCNLTL